MSDPENPDWVWRGSWGSLGGKSDHYAYVAAGRSGLKVFDISLFQLAPELEPTFLDASGFHLTLRAESGQVLRLQRSRDLKTWEDWQVITNENGFHPLVDESAGDETVRFYRVISP